jgi:IS5 family transposase
MKSQPGFFDVYERYAKLSEAGDPLERLVQVVDFEVFRHQLRSALNRSDRGKGGRPPYDPVLMFKILVLQALYNLSDDQTEFQIRDRLSFMRFLGLGFSDAVPDAKTIWLFRELLVRARAMVRPDGVKVAELVVPSFGYKNHVDADQRFGFVRRYLVTHAAANDGKPLPEVLDPTNLSSKVWADTAYRSARNERYMDRHGFVSKVHFRKPKGRPMPEAHRKANVARSKVRSAIEHVFAAEKHRFGMFVCTIGIDRARLKIGMVNLVYNFFRLVWLEEKTSPA